MKACGSGRELFKCDWKELNSEYNYVAMLHWFTTHIFLHSTEIEKRMEGSIRQGNEILQRSP